VNVSGGSLQREVLDCSEDSDCSEGLEFSRDGLAWCDGGDEGVIEERSDLIPKND